MKFNLFVAFIIFLGSCCAPKPENSTVAVEPKNAQEYLEAATLFTQQAGEYRALCHQAYNLAELRLKEALTRNPQNPAVVLDLDETVLDNSAFTAWQVSSANAYNEELWAQWTDLAEAPEVPGATRFLKLADSLGVTLYYISNRSVSALQSTIKNMQNLGMPQLEEAHFKLKTTTSNKESRRQEVIDAGHEIVLFIGDNLGDYHHRWDKQSNEKRNASVDSLATDFGSKFIVLPNTLYGTWEGAIYNFDWSITDEKRDSLRKAALKPAAIKFN
jgi:5'-nucleotidase (lipoprotein e(P4) family)